MNATSLAAAAASGSGTPNYAPVFVVLAIFVPICAAIAVSVASYYRLQRHRADAVAMASYRKLAEEAVAGMGELRGEMAKLTEHVATVEQLMRDVG